MLLFIFFLLEKLEFFALLRKNNTDIKKPLLSKWFDIHKKSFELKI